MKARKKKPTPKPEIERQVIPGETGRRNYEILLLSLVKYKDNPYTFIDLMIFQRCYGDDEELSRNVGIEGNHRELGQSSRTIHLPSYLYVIF